MAAGATPARSPQISAATTAYAGTLLATLLLLGALAARTAATGHAPWSNLHEFSASFAFGLLAVFHALARRRPIGGLAPWVGLVAAALVGISLVQPDDIHPLVPALQAPLLLTVHVGTAMLAYAIGAVAFAAALGEIVQRAAGDHLRLLPPAAVCRAAGHPGRHPRVPDPHRRDRPRIGLGQPRLALVLEQRPQGACRGGDLARVRRLPAHCRTTRPMGRSGALAAGSRIRRDRVHLAGRGADVRRPALVRRGLGLSPRTPTWRRRASPARWGS